MSRVVLTIRDNEGYTAEQAGSRHTLADLLHEVEAAIDDFGEDAEVVTFNLNNPRGASWGRFIIDYGVEDVETFEVPDSMWD